MRRSMIALLSVSASTLALALPAHAQSAPAAADDAAQTTPEDNLDDPIIVTGTRVANRTASDSAVPIDVISSEALSSSGLGETNKILNQLVPSFNFPQPSISDGSDVLRPATLRGLSPDQTLVLVNGKRRHVSALLNINGTVGRGSAAVDLNTIPALAIERVEVLRDGASSQYGSDAIAGVINIQLKRGSKGGRAQASFGKYITTLDGVQNVTGLQTSGGQPLLSSGDARVFAVNTDGERKARDGEFTTFAANIGIPIGEGFINLTGEYRDRNATNRSAADIRPNYNRVPNTPFDPRELTFNRLSFRYGDAKTEDYNVFVNASIPVGNFDAYAFGSYSHRDGLSAANYRQANNAGNRDYSTITPGTTPAPANFTALRPDGFLPLINTDLDDYAGTLGVKGDVAGWGTDLSIGYGRNSFDYVVQNSLNTSYGTASQSEFDAGGLAFRQIVANLDFSKNFEVGLAGPLTVAAGAEYRDENFKIRAGDLQSYSAGPLFRPSVVTTAANCVTLGGVYTGSSGLCSFPGRAAAAGAQGFPGIPLSATTDRSRHSYAGYLELDAELADGLTTTLAGRYEHFSDFGSTSNVKMALRYEFAPGFALRSSVSNGFRAPSLQQQFFTTTSTNFIGGFPVDISTLAVDSPVARALGSKPLKPEKSVNFSVGATANPLRGLNLTIDFYKIKIRDRVVLTENLGAAGSGTAAVNTAVKAILDANGFQSVGAARFFINGLDTTTKGVDAVISYRTNIASLGTWNFTAAYNHNENKIDRRLNALGPLATIPNIVLFGRLEGIRFTDGQPSSKLVLSADGNIGDFGITARTTRYGEVISPDAALPLGAAATSLTALGPDDQILGAKFVTDLEIRYKIAKRFTLAVGSDNILDVYPDRRPTGARPAAIGGVYPANFQYLPYTGLAPFGFNGRFVYARVSVDF
ncbi:TonB-dependent receptor [Sphingomonas sp. So64.6b]|uniref:TonB-dependent receptor plug domain-containing protein n=1 Tax=Sphingomonas sp. So64.6b TaxID=2997354 RepID=UPI0016009A6C|nr:TonB-dependent receptor [Sphingomonas sp. So64.6b]QNA83161.1 TonB-dependent receptor [Sphingomonas sp. So64.6b]